MLEPPDAAVARLPQFDLDAFAAAFGEPLSATLDLRTWSAGEDLATLYERLAAEVAAAVAQEARVRGTFRDRVFPRLREARGAPPDAGVHPVTIEELEQVHQGLLFNGGVEACDGTILTYDALPLTVYQVGVGLVAYQGAECTWVQRLYRRDLRVASADPVEEALELLRRRERRGGVGETDTRDQLSRLASQAIMSYAERGILLRQAKAPWRLGHGSPAPFELITGSGSRDLMVEATRLLEGLVCGHQRFVFVPSAPARRLLLSIGQALNPLEYAIVDWYSDHIAGVIEQGEYYGEAAVDTTVDWRRLTPEQWIRRFLREVASQVVVGVYRASRLAPPQLFYAHKDHSRVAARIALADSVLQAHRGFPLLIDLADRVCAASFGGDSLRGPLDVAYTEAGAPLRYLAERATRYQA
jgi:hypothetical protein